MLQMRRGTGPRLDVILGFVGVSALVLCSAGPAQSKPDHQVEVSARQQESPPAPQAEPTKRPRTAEQVVGGKCLQCHRKVVEEFVNEVHGKSAHFMVGSSEATCETCHGPGDKHNDTTLKADILNPPSMPGADVNRMCLTCHKQDHNRMFFSASQHERQGMSCISCHSTHHAKSPGKELVKATEGEMCTTCHTDIKKAYYQRSTHLFRTDQKAEKISCASCHNPHGSERERLLVGVSTNSECYTCHAERRAPMLWEHAPVRESCMNCHVAHGSNSLFLLKARSPLLCQQCHMHMLWRHQTIGGFDAFSYNRGCTNCHSQVHGSNHPSGKTLTR